MVRGHQIHFIMKVKLIEFVGLLGILYVTFKSVQLIMEIRDGCIKEIKVWEINSIYFILPNNFIWTNR